MLYLVTTFSPFLENICYDCFPVSQMFYCLILFEIIDWVFKKIPIRSGGGVRWIRVRTHWGLIANVHVRMVGRGGQILAILVLAY